MKRTVILLLLALLLLPAAQAQDVTISSGAETGVHADALIANAERCAYVLVLLPFSDNSDARHRDGERGRRWGRPARMSHDLLAFTEDAQRSLSKAVQRLYTSDSFHATDGGIKRGSIETIQDPLCALCTLVSLCGKREIS